MYLRIGRFFCAIGKVGFWLCILGFCFGHVHFFSCRVVSSPHIQDMHALGPKEISTQSRIYLKGSASGTYAR